MCKMTVFASLLVQEKSEGVCKGVVLILQGERCASVRTSCHCHAQRRSEIARVLRHYMQFSIA